MHTRFVELLAAPISTSCRVAGNRVFTLERGGGEAQFRLIGRSATDPAAAATTLIDPAALLEDPTAASTGTTPPPTGIWSCSACRSAATSDRHCGSSTSRRASCSWTRSPTRVVVGRMDA